MASMDDLVATVSGSMHVSQDHYELQNFRNYLAQTMVMPQVPHSGFLPPSRSTSNTRKSQPVTTPSYTNFEHNQPYPSPAGNGRPGSLQRRTSYGFGHGHQQDLAPSSGWMNEDDMDIGMNAMAGPSSPPLGGCEYEYDAFESDAFAPLNRPNAFAQQQTQVNDPWARIRQPTAFGQSSKQMDSQPANPWAAFGRSTNGFGAGSGGGGGFTQVTPTQRYGGGRMPTPPDEDDEMMSDVENVLDLDGDDDEDGFDQEENRRYGSAPPHRAAGQMAEDKRAWSMTELNEQERIAALWQRGRRKT